jgi:hypothetical protein
VPEPLDLRREHGQIRLLRLLARGLGHARDRAREDVQELLLEVDKLVIRRYPALRVRERIRLGVFSGQRSLEIGTQPSRPCSLLFVGGHV